jgi:hypothetical protein
MTTNRFTNFTSIRAIAKSSSFSWSILPLILSSMRLPKGGITTLVSLKMMRWPFLPLSTPISCACCLSLTCRIKSKSIRKLTRKSGTFLPRLTNTLPQPCLILCIKSRSPSSPKRSMIK